MVRSFPHYRPRRMRASGFIRDLVRETTLSVNDLIWPIFVRDGEGVREEIDSLPGVFRLSVDEAVKEAKRARDLGIPLIALFPYTPMELRDERASEALNPDNLVNRATRAIKAAVPDIGLMLDVALDPYSIHGQDGLVRDGVILNDETIDILCQQAVVQAEAGADILGPSDMMDGRIGAIREALDRAGYENAAIMAYSAKFASAYYGPFRDAVGAAGVLKGDKKTYQIDPANGDEALRMIGRDLDEGADMVMVKPGQPYLDICARAADRFDAPLFAYQVSGEYNMIETAMRAGHVSDTVMLESLLAFKRAGCQGILTYFAPRIAAALQDARG